MACTPATIAFLLDQIGTAGPVVAKKMFGEYAILCSDRLVALVCDDAFYLKPTAEGRALLGASLAEAPPYPGAKPYFLIAGDAWDDAEFMADLVRTTAAALPPPRRKPVRRAVLTPPASPPASPRRGRRAPGTR